MSAMTSIAGVVGESKGKNYTENPLDRIPSGGRKGTKHFHVPSRIPLELLDDAAR